MTLSQIRNEIHRFQRQFAKELAVFRLPPTGRGNRRRLGHRHR